MELGPYPIKGLRTSWGYRQEYMAEQLGISLPSYRKKEYGDVKFNDKEKVKIAEILKLSPAEMNTYLYDGALPIDKVEDDAESTDSKPEVMNQYEACLNHTS